ncbi:MAG TPA: type II toxin-antitoxin system prevent-host-death family antitoxin [Longimicrobiales bacterium]
MRQASIAEFKARLSEYVAAARRGEEVIITDRGRPVARLSGLSADRKLDARIADLVRAGLIRPPQRALSPGFRSAARPADPDGRALAALIAEREDGR